MRCTRDTIQPYAAAYRTRAEEPSFHEQTEAALRGGAPCVRPREKGMDEGTFPEDANNILSLPNIEEAGRDLRTLSEEKAAKY